VSIKEAHEAITRAIELLESARLSLAEASGTLPQLTPREREVLFLMGQRFSTRQIAERLEVTEKTAKNISLIVVRKMGVRTRHEAIERYRMLAQVEPDEVRVPQLSERETAVWPLLGQGMTNRQIADELGVPINTASYLAWKIVQKLGVRNRQEAREKYRLIEGESSVD
jgi:DNA-binding NarL/FixJ family response regulator